MARDWLGRERLPVDAQEDNPEVVQPEPGVDQTGPLGDEREPDADTADPGDDAAIADDLADEQDEAQDEAQDSETEAETTQVSAGPSAAVRLGTAARQGWWHLAPERRLDCPACGPQLARGWCGWWCRLSPDS